MQIQALCNKHRLEKGYHGMTLRNGKVADKCDCCDATVGVLSSSKWRKSPNGSIINFHKKLAGMRKA